MITKGQHAKYNRQASMHNRHLAYDFSEIRNENPDFVDDQESQTL